MKLTIEYSEIKHFRDDCLLPLERACKELDSKTNVDVHSYCHPDLSVTYDFTKTTLTEKQIKTLIKKVTK